MAARIQLAARRKALGFSQEALADAVGVNVTTYARWERGELSPSAKNRKALAHALDIEPIRFDRLLDTDPAPATESGPLKRQFGQLAALEQAATEVKYFHPLVVPGLLQTDAYAAAVDRTDHRLVYDDGVASRIEIRHQRQQALERERDPLRLVCVIDEAVLARQVGGRATMAEQLDHLLVSATRPNIQLRIAPLASSIYGAAVGDFSVLAFQGDSPGIACTEDLWSVRYLEARHEVEGYDALFDHLYHQSLSLDDSLDRIEAHRRKHEP
ncbi:MAG: Scr1 family TA system antitoxin-like transcriptional regulator [Actinomycetota bacterium]